MRNIADCRAIGKDADPQLTKTAQSQVLINAVTGHVGTGDQFFRKAVPAQRVDATLSKSLIQQHFPREPICWEYSIRT